MSLPRLRRRVATPEFARWRAALPGLALPGWLDGDAGACRGAAEEGSGRAAGESGEALLDARSRGVTVPPMVAAALALQGDPGVCVLFRVREPGGTVTGAVAQEDGVVSSVVRRVPPDGVGVPGEAWVEVSLVPVDHLVTEVLRWVPSRPAAGTQIEVRVMRHDDAVASGRWDWPDRPLPGGPAVGDGCGGDGCGGDGCGGDGCVGDGCAADGVRERLSLALTSCLAGCLDGDVHGPRRAQLLAAG